MTATEKKVLRQLNNRMQAHSNGVLVFFREAGVYTEKPTLEGLKQIYEEQPEVFEKIIKFLYPEVYPSNTANAFDWMSLVGGILTGAGGGLMNTSANDTAAAQQAALAQQQLAAEAQKAKTTKMYVIGGVVVVVALVIVVLVTRRK